MIGDSDVMNRAVPSGRIPQRCPGASAASVRTAVWRLCPHSPLTWRVAVLHASRIAAALRFGAAFGPPSVDHMTPKGRSSWTSDGVT